MTKKTLLAAAALVEQGWTRYHNAEDADGFDVEHDDPRACAYCAAGAIRKAATSETHAATVLSTFGEYLGIRTEAGNGYSVEYGVTQWNDADIRTQDEVVAALREAAGVAA